MLLAIKKEEEKKQIIIENIPNYSMKYWNTATWATGMYTEELCSSVAVFNRTWINDQCLIHMCIPHITLNTLKVEMVHPRTFAFSDSTLLSRTVFASTQTSPQTTGPDRIYYLWQRTMQKHKNKHLYKINLYTRCKKCFMSAQLSHFLLFLFVCTQSQNIDHWMIWFYVQWQDLHCFIPFLNQHSRKQYNICTRHVRNINLADLWGLVYTAFTDWQCAQSRFHTALSLWLSLHQVVTVFKLNRGGNCTVGS